jgi:hypothetical protein
MADQEKPRQSGQGPDYHSTALPAAIRNVLDNAAFPAAVLDVIVRAIDLAKQKPETVGDPGGDAKELFCAACYGEPGTGCIIAYWRPGQ